jgi:NADH-quinone oxidoreductase subunit E
MINYDFHEDLTTEKVDVLLQIYRDGQGKDVK